MQKPNPEMFYDFQQVADYLEQKYNLKRHIFVDWAQRSSSYYGQNVIVEVMKEFTNPEAYHIKPEEITYLRTLLRVFGTTDRYGVKHVYLKVWW